MLDYLNYLNYYVTNSHQFKCNIFEVMKAKPYFFIFQTCSKHSSASIHTLQFNSPSIQVI